MDVAVLTVQSLLHKELGNLWNWTVVVLFLRQLFAYLENYL